MSLQTDLSGFKQRMSMLDPNKPLTVADANIIADLLIKLSAATSTEFVISAPGVTNPTNKVTVIQGDSSITWDAQVDPV